MYLKSLTLKGFKSFASPTTLRFEPGITAVVGPNGSGKSNVVDALAWVMGEQGAKTLRGGKMEDVIFAGTSSRAPLGRAEVTVTIDNSDNALPIEYSEVSITRRMFRDGASEYEINGSSCRLMDVQELLSDSGIGREMHVIVGQGKLDEILQSRPEDRRAFIEEAAGRAQAPQAQRKGAAQARRDAGEPGPAHRSDHRTATPAQTPGPPGRGGPARADHPGRPARRHGCGWPPTTWSTGRPSATRSSRPRRRCAASMTRPSPGWRWHREELAAHEEALIELSQRADSVQQTWFGLSALAERVGATVRIASERAQHLDVEPATSSDTDPRNPEELDAEAEQVAAAEQQLLAELGAARSRLETARAELADRERRGRRGRPGPPGGRPRRSGPA